VYLKDLNRQVVSTCATIVGANQSLNIFQPQFATGGSKYVAYPNIPYTFGTTSVPRWVYPPLTRTCPCCLCPCLLHLALGGRCIRSESLQPIRCGFFSPCPGGTTATKPKSVRCGTNGPNDKKKIVLSILRSNLSVCFNVLIMFLSHSHLPNWRLDWPRSSPSKRDTGLCLIFFNGVHNDHRLKRWGE
jgi:hypothetical protein